MKCLRKEKVRGIRRKFSESKFLYNGDCCPNNTYIIVAQVFYTCLSLPLTRARATRYDCRFSRISCTTRRRHYPGKKRKKKKKKSRSSANSGRCLRFTQCFSKRRIAMIEAARCATARNYCANKHVTRSLHDILIVTKYFAEETNKQTNDRIIERSLSP